MKNLIFAFVLVLGCVFGAFAAGTETKEFCSENKKHCLRIETNPPVEKSSEPEDEREESDDNDEEPEDVVVVNTGTGTFLTNSRELWTVKLADENPPESALVADDGSFVVTFGKQENLWSRDAVVTIYSGLNGRLIKNLALRDFLTGSDANQLSDVSSIWYKDGREIDYDRRELVLSVVNPHGKEAFFKVRIDLTNGAVLDEIVDRIPVYELVLIAKNFEENQNPRLIEARKDECVSDEEIVELSTVDFALKVVQREPLQFSAAARAVQATGEAVFEVVVSTEGEVACIRQISGHPLLRIGLENSIKKWKFEPRDTKYKGRIVVESKSVLTLNGNPIE